MSVATITALMFGSLIILLMTGLPIAFCLGALAVVFTAVSFGASMLPIVATTAIGSMLTIVMIAIPLFIFMGIMLQHSGLADDLYNTVYQWAGPLRGGLAMGTVFICTLFAAMAGISGAATVTMGIIALPAMLKRGYNKHMVVGSIMAGGALGILIPPSITMVVYAFWANESVGRLFAGGIFSGLLLSALFISYIGIRAYFQPHMAPAIPKEERVSLRKKVVSLKSVILPILLILAVLGSIMFGIATPTEASAVGAAGAVICAAIYRRLTLENFTKTSRESLKLTVMIMFIAMGAATFSHVYEAIGGVEVIKEIIHGLTVNRWMILIAIQICYLILGCLLDPIGIIMITTPVFLPIILALGFDPVWFGVLFVMNMEIGFLTPPFGVNLFYMKAIVPKDITMGDIYRSIIPFVLLQMAGLIICMLLPQVILWLPNTIFGIRP